MNALTSPFEGRAARGKVVPGTLPSAGALNLADTDPRATGTLLSNGFEKARE